MSKKDLIQKIMNCCFADDSGKYKFEIERNNKDEYVFWENFRDWEKNSDKQDFIGIYGRDKNYQLRDPDDTSKKLYKMHEFLWNTIFIMQTDKKIPKVFNPKNECELIIENEKIHLGSDSIISIYWHWKRMQFIFADNNNKNLMEKEIKKLEKEVDPKRKEECFYDTKWDDKTDYKNKVKKFIWLYLQKANTIGGFMVFPRHNVPTINTARNYSKIRDRFDLTLECIRRFYVYQPQNKEVSRDDYADNPLFCSLNKNHWPEDMKFFKSFASFEEYIDFFCLDAWVTKDKSNKYLVKNLLSDENVQTLDNWDFNQQEPLPQNAVEWWQFYTNIMSRLDERNKKIEDLLEDKLLQKRRPAS